VRLLVPVVALALLAAPGAVGASGAKVIDTRREVLSISADGGNVANGTRTCSTLTPAASSFA
jgi:hypothetical protein